MVPADDDHKDTPEVDSSASTKECKGSRLTPMPKCLMHWWIPFVLAAFLFLGSMFITSIWGSATFDEIMHAIQDCPKRWPFHMRTPSREEIEVCLTITAAGFAFSAWQQRSHDNAIREEERTKAQQQFEQELRDREQDRLDKQHQFDIEREERERNRLEQIQREEYWRRREQIFQILASNNPGLRLAAVSLLAELADAATHRTQLSVTEIQQLQRHIIDTLCLQMRHEGLNLTNEGTLEEHAEIQRAIFQVLLERIQNAKAEHSHANWSRQYINLKQCNILTEVAIYQIQTNATLDLRDSVFQEQVTIFESQIGQLFWKNAYFMKQLSTHGENVRTVIKTNELPQHAGIAQFFNTTFISTKQGLNLNLQTRQNDKTIPLLSFVQCDFRKTTCECPTTCQCRDSATTTDCSCKAEDECMCTNTCTRNKLLIQTESTATQPNNTLRNLFISICSASDMQISLETDTPRISILNSRITNLFKITFEHNYTPVQSPTEQETGAILVWNCTFTRNQLSPEPVHIAVNTPSTISKPIIFRNNSIFDLSGTGATHKLNAIPLFSRYDSYHFVEEGDSNDRLTRWDTGLSTTPISIHRDDNPFSAFACGEHANTDSIQFRIATKADSESILELSDQSKNIENADTFGRPTPNEYIPHKMLNTLIKEGTLYLVSDSMGPLATFALIPGSNSANSSFLNGWHSNSEYHTLRYVTAVRGRGIAHAIFNYVVNRANYVRCDTSEHNVAMQHALEAFGFKKCGTFTGEDETKRVVYDWIKETELSD